MPLSVKENIDLAGTPTTNSLAVFAEAVVSSDAPAVERMKAAGAIPISRTNLPDLGLRVATESSLHGITRNPWNSSRTAGGSSGGEGSSLASGMSPIGLGNDIGGSLRNPAHCCGIASIKPSTGVVPAATELPPDDSSLMFQLMAVEGVMARRVADVIEAGGTDADGDGLLRWFPAAPPDAGVVHHRPASDSGAAAAEDSGRAGNTQTDAGASEGGAGQL